MIEYSGKSDALVKAVLSCSEGWLMKVAGVSDLTSKCKGPWCGSSVFQHVQLFHRIAGLNWMTQPWRFANQEQSQSDKQGYICRGKQMPSPEPQVGQRTETSLCGSQTREGYAPVVEGMLQQKSEFLRVGA